MKVIEGTKVPIKMWLTDIEDGALKQAHNAASLPFVFHHIAIMPDAHQGYGVSIGSVFATEGVIIPNAVGVDIGCFSGDTKIPLLNGTQKTLKELSETGKEVYVYSLDEKLNFVPGKAIPRLTRRNQELLEVIISGGETIKCTLDHKFMLKDGTYKEAKNLQVHDSLMPLYRHYSNRDGYEHIKTTIHKVLSVKKLDYKEDVYCLTVKKYHNFALSAGVFVHNCGMCAVKTSLKAEQLDKETLKKIFGGSEEYHGGIRSAIPLGFNHHSKKQDADLMPLFPSSSLGDKNGSFQIVLREYESALKQIGTLGGGNHFIEIQKDLDNNVWVMIHSGSRNLGKQVADYYNEIAINLNKRWHTSVPKEWQLAFLPIESKEGKDYLNEMNYCVDFAFASRKLMMERVIDEIRVAMVKDGIVTIVDTEPIINIAHNYAKFEHHFGKNVIVHRKGATLARKDTIGIIPGSQGSKSYIVKGLGNPDSFMSCSHGAGRKMSRTKACNELDLAQEIKKLDDQGIVHGIRTKNDLDEASGAYKDIDQVMSEQKDLVEIITELSPIAVLKG